MSQIQLHRGGQARRVKGALAREHIKRELHGLAIQVQGDRTIAEVAACAPQGVNVAAWWADVRSQRAAVYGSLFRFIDIAVRLRAPKSVLLVIPQVIAEYINECVDEREHDTPPRQPPAVIRRAA